MKTVLYIHGFASSPAGRKIALLREILEPQEFRLVAPDLNVPSFRKLDFQAAARLVLWEAKRHAPAVIVGSSLGALVALEATRRGASAPLVLVAPAVGFGQRWTEKLGPGDPLLFFHHATGREQPIHRRFFEELAGLAVDREPPRAPVTVVIGTRDESVPFELVRGIWEAWAASGRLAPGSKFLAIEGGDHGLVERVPVIAEEILRLGSPDLAP